MQINAFILDSLIIPNEAAEPIKSYINGKIGYFQMPNVYLNTNLTNWWQKYCSTFLKFEILAKKYVCIPGTSVSCERL